MFSVEPRSALLVKLIVFNIGFDLEDGVATMK